MTILRNTVYMLHALLLCSGCSKPTLGPEVFADLSGAEQILSEEKSCGLGRDLICSQCHVVALGSVSQNDFVAYLDERMFVSEDLGGSERSDMDVQVLALEFSGSSADVCFAAPG